MDGGASAREAFAFWKKTLRRLWGREEGHSRRRCTTLGGTAILLSPRCARPPHSVHFFFLSCDDWEGEGELVALSAAKYPDAPPGASSIHTHTHAPG